MSIRPTTLARPANAFPGLRGFSGIPVPAAVLRMPAFCRDATVLLTVILGYFVLRGIAPERLDFAVWVSGQIVAFERWAGVFWEPHIQDISIRYHFVQEVANFTYAYLHFPVLGAVAAWLWWKDREAYVFARNVMFVSMIIGLFFYYAFPAAPPRLLSEHGIDLGFTDTVFGGNTSVNYAQPSLILNEYAAIPSFHFGWIAMAAGIIWINTSSRLARSGAIFLVVLMTWAIVASANHFFVDMALGGLVIAVSWVVAREITARAALQPGAWDGSYRGP